MSTRRILLLFGCVSFSLLSCEYLSEDIWDELGTGVTPTPNNPTTPELSVPFKGDVLAYYPFEGNADDCSENKLHGMSKDVRPTKDRHGTENAAFYFGGGDQRVILPNSSILDLAQYQGFTITMWVKGEANQDNWSCLINKGEGYAEQLCVDVDFNKYRFWVRDRNNNDYLLRSQSLVESGWHQIAVSYGDSSLTFYLNGELVKTLEGPSEIRESDSSIVIGSRPYSENFYGFEGAIDDVCIYSRKLASHELRTAYMNTKAEEQSPGFNCEDAWKVDSATTLFLDLDIEAVDEAENRIPEHINITYAEGICGNAVQMVPESENGKSIVRFDHEEYLQLKEVSMEALVYSDQLGSDYNHIIDKAWTYGLSIRNGKICCHFVGKGFWYTGVEFPLSQWVYLVATYDGKTARVYVNGELGAEKEYGLGAVPDNTHPLGIGNCPIGSHDVPFSGKIDLVRISDRARTTCEIAKAWNTLGL